MTCVRNWVKIAVFIVAVFTFTSSVPANPTSPECTGGPEGLIEDLKVYFVSYYTIAQERGGFKPPADVISDINSILLKNNIVIDRELYPAADTDLGSLSAAIDAYLEDYGKAFNIFLVEGLDIVNCWLGDLSRKIKEKKLVWGKEAEFTVKTIDNLDIEDFIYFSSAGDEAIDIGTRDKTVYVNGSSFYLRAAKEWRFLEDASAGKFQRRYNPYKSDRLRRRLRTKMWYNIYKDCIERSNDRDAARKEFVRDVADGMKEIALFHEAGHIIVGQFLDDPHDEAREEMLAFLTELRYGPMPYESLDTVISASFRSSMDYYRIAGRAILNSFIVDIEDAQSRGDPSYVPIFIEWQKLEAKINGFSNLTEEQIRTMSNMVFREKFKE